MFPIATRQGGTCEAFPDTCKTPAPPAPPVPVPYPNTAQLVQANPGTCAKKVKVLNQPVITKQTVIPMSAGDEAGAAGGVVSGTIKGPVQFKQGSAKVKVEGQPVVFQTCMTAHNGTNANMPAGVHSSPSQTKVSVAM
ncbi:PAAR-like domain-containing protein [Sorangium sp. So ce296]|uniref:Type VI secretion protein n=1 Tax=Sorangium cellulosum TaxID=56 RepID=A0A150SV03_SORCE|nr:MULTISPECIES: PAAR-like domain-containing protein [Sorangium]AUX31883.1 type VI secretion protein [Sorangium cellulosum]KYF85539.1 type VI secretion protein [Sorangium cellulosum]KYF96261.1 type VI secretion protein [Sorangium cellulosum]WCQ91257.1 hypothetical protein NQZ70_03972 [Sorangium sp. Soce836]